MRGLSTFCLPVCADGCECCSSTGGGSCPELGPGAASVESTGGFLVRSGPRDGPLWVVLGRCRPCREEGDANRQPCQLSRAGVPPRVGVAGRRFSPCRGLAGPCWAPPCITAYLAYLPGALTDSDISLSSRRKSHQGGWRAWDHQSCDVQDSGRALSSHQAWARAQVSPIPGACRIRAEPVLLG